MSAPNPSGGHIVEYFVVLAQPASAETFDMTLPARTGTFGGFLVDGIANYSVAQPGIEYTCSAEGGGFYGPGLAFDLTMKVSHTEQTVTVASISVSGGSAPSGNFDIVGGPTPGTGTIDGGSLKLNDVNYGFSADMADLRSSVQKDVGTKQQLRFDYGAGDVSCKASIIVNFVQATSSVITFNEIKKPYSE